MSFNQSQFQRWDGSDIRYKNLQPPRFLATAATVVAALLFNGSSVGAEFGIQTVGVLTPRKSYEPVLDGLREGLGRLGYKEGRDLQFIVEDSRGDSPNFESLAKKLLESKPGMIFTVATAPTVAAKRIIATVPIVFALVGDPVQAQVVASFSSSGNNVTGVSSYSPTLSGKRLELLKEIAPSTKSILAVVSAKGDNAKLVLQALEQPAKKMKIKIVRRDVSSAKDIDKVLMEHSKRTIDAIFLSRPSSRQTPSTS